MGGDDPLSAYKMNASAAAMFGGGATSAREGHALREHSFIEQTENQLDAFLAQGREVLSNLVEQRGILKGTQRKLLDAANTMGLSRDVIVSATGPFGLPRMIRNHAAPHAVALRAAIANAASNVASVAQS